MNGSVASEAGLPEFMPEMVVDARAGSVLFKGTILKSDHFPGCQNTKLTPQVEGCPNFRQIEGLPVFGVAIPTAQGLRNMLQKLSRDLPAGTTVYWHNMREEPLIYISGRPFVVRERENPFMNLEYTGIHMERVEEMEDRLRVDILTEAAQYDQQILVADEDDDFNVFNMMQRVTEQDVLTPKAMFDELRSDGFNVVYSRIPITDEKGPKPKDFDRIVKRVHAPEQPAAFVFNCQMGRGRTTTGMVIAALALMKRNRVLDPVLEVGSQGALPDPGADESAFETPAWFKEGIERSLASEATAMSAQSTDSTALMSAGHLLVVRSLLRVLPRATFAKAALDAVIDACSAMQNLRSVIVRYRANMMKEPREDKRARILTVCTDHIDRYCHLIVFSAYLGSQKREGQEGFQPFLDSLPEIRSVLERLLWAFPLLTLELDAESGQEKHLEGERTLTTMSEGVKQRRGALLTASTILKADNYPSLLAPSIPQPLTGATNFRQAEHNLPVFGAGISTLQGIQRALQLIGCGPSGIPPVDAACFREGDGSGAAGEFVLPADGRRVAIWHNLREEPVLYINGTPYVLRETAGPYNNMREYSGIDGPRLEAMEESLKEDVLQEAHRLGGKVNVLYEEMTGVEYRTKGHRTKRRGRLMSGFELVLDKSAVQTPRQMYANLARAGYCVQYKRVPITDGKCPGHDDITTIHESLVSAPRGKACFVFNCQQGKGRTTIGMVMATLFLTSPVWLDQHIFGVPEGTVFPVPALPRARPKPQEPSNVVRTLQNPSNVSMTRQDTDSVDGDSDIDSCKSPTRQSQPPVLAANTDATAVSSPDNTSPHEHSAHLEGQPSSEIPNASPSVVPASYLGVRRLLAEIADSAAIVSWLDGALDSCSHMVNLREVIGSHRRGPMPASQMRPEFSRLRQAFERDAVALARYCLLTTYAAYLHHNGAKVGAGTLPPQGAGDKKKAAGKPFKEWVASMRSVQVALAAPLDDPVQALTPILPAFPPRSNSSTPFNLPDHAMSLDGCVAPAVVQQVLATRRFRMLTPHTILKSFHQNNLPLHSQQNLFPHSEEGEETLPGVLDLRHVVGKPICLVSNPSIQGLRALVERLGGKSGKKVVLLDTREELCVYLGGHPYTRRDIEMPTASLHHAGIHWRELKRLEEWLLEDIRMSSGNWVEENSHRVLVHKEVPVLGAKATRTTEDATDVTLQRDTTTPLTAHWLHINADSVTSVYNGITSVWEVVSAIAQEGAALWYRRMPLSRNRTPSHQDLSELHEGAFCADGSTEDVHYVIIARAASSSTSACFAAHFLCTVLDAVEEWHGRRSSEGGGVATGVKAARTASGSSSHETLDISVVDNLCRVLDRGTDCREQVDHAIRQLDSQESGQREMRDILQCISACRAKVARLQSLKNSPNEAGWQKLQELSAAKRLGAHYLMRYFLLIAFRTFLQTWLDDHASGEAKEVTFSSWFERRQELGHLLNTCMQV